MGIFSQVYVVLVSWGCGLRGVWFLKSGSGLGFGNGDGVFDHLQIHMEIGLVAGAGDTIDEHGLQVMVGFVNEFGIGQFGEIKMLWQVAKNGPGSTKSFAVCLSITGISACAGVWKVFESLQGSVHNWYLYGFERRNRDQMS
jgi:hypothetical protein